MKNINPLETEGFTVEETSFPVTVEVTHKPEESIARETGNDASKDTCDIAVAKDHVEVIEQTTGVGMNGVFVAENHAEVTEQSSNVKVNEVALTKDHVEVMEHNTEVKVMGKIDQEDGESETATYNMDDVD